MEDEEDLEAILARDLAGIVLNETVESDYGSLAPISLSPLAATAAEIAAESRSSNVHSAWREYRDCLQAFVHDLDPGSRSNVEPTSSVNSANGSTTDQLQSADATVNVDALQTARLAGQIYSLWAADDAVNSFRTGSERSFTVSKRPLHLEPPSNSTTSEPEGHMGAELKSVGGAPHEPTVVPDQSLSPVSMLGPPPSVNLVNAGIHRQPQQSLQAVPSTTPLTCTAQNGSQDQNDGAVEGKVDSSDLSHAPLQVHVASNNALQDAVRKAQADAAQAMQSERASLYARLEADRRRAEEEAQVAAQAQAHMEDLERQAEDARHARQAAVEAARLAAIARAQLRAGTLLQCHVRGWLTRKRVRLADLLLTARQAKLKAEVAAAELRAKEEEERRRMLAERACAERARAEAERRAAEAAAIAAAEEGKRRAESLRMEAAAREAALVEQRRLALELEARQGEERARMHAEALARQIAVERGAMSEEESQAAVLNSAWKKQDARAAQQKKERQAMSAADAESRTYAPAFAREAAALVQKRMVQCEWERRSMQAEEQLAALLARLASLQDALSSARGAGRPAPLAAVLQAAWRGRRARRDPSNPVLCHRARQAGRAAQRVQAVWRGHRLRVALARALEAARLPGRQPAGVPGMDGGGGDEDEDEECDLGALLDLPQLPQHLLQPLKAAPGHTGAISGDLIDQAVGKVAGQQHAARPIVRAAAALPADVPPSTASSTATTSGVLIQQEEEGAGGRGGRRAGAFDSRGSVHSSSTSASLDPRAPSASTVTRPGPTLPPTSGAPAMAGEDTAGSASRCSTGGEESWDAHVSRETLEHMARRKAKMLGGSGAGQGSGREGHGLPMPAWSNAVPGDLLSKPAEGIQQGWASTGPSSSFVGRVRGAIGRAATFAWGSGEAAFGLGAMAKGQARMPSVQDNLPDHLRPARGSSHPSPMPTSWMQPLDNSARLGKGQEAEGMAGLLPVQQASPAPLQQSKNGTNTAGPSHAAAASGSGSATIGASSKAAKLRLMRAAMDGML